MNRSPDQITRRAVSRLCEGRDSAAVLRIHDCGRQSEYRRLIPNKAYLAEVRAMEARK